MALIDVSKLDGELCNTVYLGLCFTVLFSAEFAAVNVQVSNAIRLRIIIIMLQNKTGVLRYLECEYM